jgi:hypothetical protein
MPQFMSIPIFLVLQGLILYVRTATLRQVRKSTAAGETAQKALTVCLTISILNYVQTLICIACGVTLKTFKFPWFAALLRPIEGVLMSEDLQRYVLRFWAVMKGSFPMVIFIVSYICYFSWMGFILF